MGANGGDLGIAVELHALAGHRRKLVADTNAQKRPELMRPRAERTWLRQLGQLHHCRHVVGAEHDHLRPAGRRVGHRADHLFAGLRHLDFEFVRRRDGFRRKQRDTIGRGDEPVQGGEAGGREVRHCCEGRDRRRIAPDEAVALRNIALPRRQSTPDRIVQRVEWLRRRTRVGHCDVSCCSLCRAGGSLLGRPGFAIGSRSSLAEPCIECAVDHEGEVLDVLATPRISLQPYHGGRYDYIQ